MSKHLAERTIETGLLEWAAIVLAERGQFPEGFGRHRATVDSVAELRDNLRTATFLTSAS